MLSVCYFIVQGLLLSNHSGGGGNARVNATDAKYVLLRTASLYVT